MPRLPRAAPREREMYVTCWTAFEDATLQCSIAPGFGVNAREKITGRGNPGRLFSIQVRRDISPLFAHRDASSKLIYGGDPGSESRSELLPL